MQLQNGTYIIAEAGVNHNGRRELAFELVSAAAAAGADAVKFQTFLAEKVVMPNVPKAAYQKQATDPCESQLEMVRKLELPREWHAELQAHAHQLKIEFLSTAFDLDSLAFLESLALPVYKIPSGEITNAPLLWAFARTGKPLIVSTGMANLGEVEMALAILAHGILQSDPPERLEQVWRHWMLPEARAAVAARVSLLHCTSQYPAPLEDLNLKAIDTLTRAFGLPVGYSDHSAGNLIPVAAVARGACIIEKHFTLDRNLPGPDHAASLVPDELSLMVREIRAVEKALGDGAKVPRPSEWETRTLARQTLLTTRAIRAGEILTPDALSTARCGGGLSALEYWDWLGRAAPRDFQPYEVLP